MVGKADDGTTVGILDGLVVGRCVGSAVGKSEGHEVGTVVGLLVGDHVEGRAVAVGPVGINVGMEVGIWDGAEVD